LKLANFLVAGITQVFENQDHKGDAGCAPIRDFLARQNYHFAFRTVNTVFFVNRDEN